MKKVTLEAYDSQGMEFFVENTPKQEDKTIDVFGYDTFKMLSKSWASQRDQFIITINEGGAAISLLLVKSKSGNGYVKRELESGKHAVGRIFDIVSPIYYIKNPVRGSATLTEMTTFAYNSDIRRCMFFPEPVTKMQMFFNQYPMNTAHNVPYGRGFGAAGRSFFYESISFEPDLAIQKDLTIVINNNNTDGATPKTFIGGEYLIL